jgi:hypothetical protein
MVIELVEDMVASVREKRRRAGFIRGWKGEKESCRGKKREKRGQIE